MMKAIFTLPALAFASLALAACATIPEDVPESTDGIARAGINQRAYVDGPRVTPLKVLEDSRCPMNARCVWAGRLRLSVRVDLGSGSQTREIATDQPIQVADGQLSLVEVSPDLMAGDTAKPKDYRFGFRFAGGR